MAGFSSTLAPEPAAWIHSCGIDALEWKQIFAVAVHKSSATLGSTTEKELNYSSFIANRLCVLDVATTRRHHATTSKRSLNSRDRRLSIGVCTNTVAKAKPRQRQRACIVECVCVCKLEAAPPTRAPTPPMRCGCPQPARTASRQEP